MSLIRTLVPALALAFLFQRMKVPAGAMIGAMLGVALVNLAGWEATALPSWTRFLALTVIGWELGRQFDRNTVSSLREAAGPVLLVVVGLVLAGGLLTWILRASGLDLPTAYLAASPGGISQMAVLSAEIGANPVLVATVHLIRITTVLLTAPVIVRLLERGG